MVSAAIFVARFFVPTDGYPAVPCKGAVNRRVAQKTGEKTQTVAANRFVGREKRVVVKDKTNGAEGWIGRRYANDETPARKTARAPLLMLKTSKTSCRTEFRPKVVTRVERSPFSRQSTCDRVG